MKKRILSLLLCLLFFVALFPMTSLATGERYLEIDGTNFPDENFRQWVRDNLAGGKDYMTKDEVDAVTAVGVSSKSIEDLTGIERFPALKELYCFANKLTALDVSKNTALEYLNCYSNKIPALDVSKNTALKHLDCGSNKIEKLDVSSLSGLEYLNCYRNELTSLDVSKNAALQVLFCQMNKLTTLDLSHNMGLTKLDISSNPFSAPVDISKLTALQHLGCYHLDLTELDLSNFPQLTELECYNNQLTALDLSHNPLLQRIQCQRNQLSALDVSKCPNLGTLNCEDNRLSALDVSKNAQLVWFNCGKNQLTALDVSQNTILKSLSCKNNQLSVLDMSQNAALERFWCGGNRLASLDLSKNTKIDPSYFDLGSQKIPDQVLAYEDGRFTYDLSALVDDKTKVTVTTAGATYDSAAGIVTFDTSEDGFTYQYDTGAGKMDVDVLFSKMGTAQFIIKTQPKSVTVKSGAKAKFSVKASGKKLTYQWYEKAAETEEWKIIPGAVKNSLSVASSLAKNGYQYRCRVQDAWGYLNTDAATLTVTPQKPVIKTQPKSLTVKSGKKVKFTVKASGPKLTYQWYSRPNEESTWGAVEGATKNSLSVTTSKANDGYQYYCRVKNNDGEVSSIKVTLTVTPEAPTIKTQPKDAKVKIGAKAKFKVKAKGKNVTYQWYYRTSETGEWVLMEGEISATLTVTATEGNIGWQFRCLAKNADGQVYSKAATLMRK